MNDLIEYNLVMSTSTGGTPVYGKAGVDAELAKRDATIETLKDKLNKISNWADAYPPDIFPEPDFKAVAKTLKDKGLSLDAVSASNMRHVLKGVKRILEDAE